MMTPEAKRYYLILHRAEARTAAGCKPQITHACLCRIYDLASNGKLRTTVTGTRAGRSLSAWSFVLITLPPCHCVQPAAGGSHCALECQITREIWSRPERSWVLGTRRKHELQTLCRVGVRSSASSRLCRCHAADPKDGMSRRIQSNPKLPCVRF
jgi:hypothetical protein